jgi:hypothetical protein
LPIGLSGDRTVTSFVCLVTDTTGQALAEFLKDHLPLLNRLPRWRVVAVAPSHIPGLPACEKVFRRVAGEAQRPRQPDEIDGLNNHFRTWDRIRRNDLREVTTAAIYQFKDARQRLGQTEFESLFQRWTAVGPAALSGPRAPSFSIALREQRGAFVTYQLPVRYDRFGTHAGVV